MYVCISKKIIVSLKNNNIFIMIKNLKGFKTKRNEKKKRNYKVYNFLFMRRVVMCVVQPKLFFPN